MRWILGDIQGCVREFEKFLFVSRFDPNRDELWCLGDLINRGPDSLATLRLWLSIGGKSLVGNHEVGALLSFSGAMMKCPRALHELFTAPDASKLMSRLRSCPVLVKLPSAGDGPDVWIVHAGVMPQWVDLDSLSKKLNAGPHDDAWLQSDAIRFVTSVRCCTADGHLSKYKGSLTGCKAPFHPWDTFYQGSVLLIHGHWAARGFYRSCRTMGLDSGCVYGGSLTAWCQEEDRLIHVPAISD